MLCPVPPASNAERQRKFRERNPGYYGRLHARRRAALRERGAAPAVARPAPLMLPAPVEPIVVPGMNSIDALREAMRAREAALVAMPVGLREASPSEAV